MLDVGVGVGLLMGFVIGAVSGLLAAHKDRKNHSQRAKTYLAEVAKAAQTTQTDSRIAQLEVDLRKIKRRIALVGHALLNHIDGRTND